jgi:hypothetical protein
VDAEGVKTSLASESPEGPGFAAREILVKTSEEKPALPSRENHA